MKKELTRIIAITAAETLLIAMAVTTIIKQVWRY